MTPCKWSLILILAGITLIGLPIGVDSDTSSEETKPLAAKDCRKHIEKALEQYWDSSETKGSTAEQHLSDQQEHEDDDQETETNKLVNNAQTTEENQKDEDEDDDDEDEDDENQQTINENNDQNNNDKPDEDDDDDDDDETKNENNVEVTEENDDDEEEEEEEDEEKNSNAENEDSDSNLSEHNDNINDSSDVSKSAETEENTTNDEEDEDDEEEEDDDEEDDGEEGSVENIQQTENESTAQNDVEKDKTEKQQSETDNDENDENDDDEEEVDDDDDEDENQSNDTVTEQVQPTEASPNEIKIEIQVESDKVTGEADRASARMASEFLDAKPSSDQPKASQVEEKNRNLTVPEESDEDDTEDGESGSIDLDDLDDDSIENIYEDEDDEDDSTSSVTYRSRDHIDVILGLDEIGTEYDKEEDKVAQSIFKEIKKIHLTQIKPMEMLYKFSDSTSRALGDAEIFNMPMLMFLGPWSAGKTSIINYLLGIERTPYALKTGTGVTDVDFTLLTYGEKKRVMSGTELAADWRYAGVQKFGQGFLDHFRSVQLPHTLLKKITIIDTPGILENKKNAERGYSLSEAFQYFIDRSDAIYVVLDPNKVDIGMELGSVIDQLKGRDARFILNKADTIRRSDLMRVVGQLFWNLSPLMSSTEAPVIYAVSLTTKPYHPSAPAKFLSDQENNFLYDMKSTLDKRVENRILYARRHAVKVRNHVKMVDCYLATYYRHKSIFSNKKFVAKQITENPREYNIFEGISGMTNVSRYDLPDPVAYREFFKLHPLYDFKPLASTCSYFRGCPMDKLDLAISKDIPELLAKYKKMKLTESSPKQER